MNTRFYNARICPMQNGPEVITGEVWVEGSRITHVGAAAGRAAPAFDREIDAAGNLLLPGFNNAHTHSGMTFLRSYADDLPLLDWLEKQVFPMEAKLTEEDVYWLSRLAILEYLTSGITANFDMYMPTGPVVRASVDSGFRTVICGGVNNFVSSPAQLEAEFAQYNGFHPRIGLRLGFHAEYTCTPGLLEQLAALVHKTGQPVYMHSSESRREVEECIARTGKTPTAWMDGFGLLDNGGGAFHCVHMTDEDLDIMKARGMAVVSNPGSNVKLASGTARLVRMLEMGIPVALGTDGPASNNCLDMFREMFLATGLQKLALDDAAALPADEVLRMACVTGARVMGLSDCDCLAPGKLADLIMIDLAQPNMQPENNITRNLVYSGSKQNVKLTMVDGAVLYEDGVFCVNADPAEIYAQANERMARMKA